MADNTVSKAKKESAALMAESFYTDFMPMVQQIKKDVATLNIAESDKNTVNRINDQLTKAESLLMQLKTISKHMVKND